MRRTAHVQETAVKTGQDKVFEEKSVSEEEAHEDETKTLMLKKEKNREKDAKNDQTFGTETTLNDANN